MFWLRSRRARRLRERGFPAVATIVGAREVGGRGRWELRLHVRAADGSAFLASADASLPAGGAPAVGSEVDVLHEPGGGSHVVLSGVPATAAVSSGGAWVDVGEGHGGGGSDEVLAAPDPLDVIRQVFAGLADGSGRTDGPTAGYVSVSVDGVPVEPRPSEGAAGADDAELARLARSDPGALAHEIMRRLATGELTPRRAITEARTVGLDGEAGDAVLQELARSGRLSPDQIERIRRHLGR